ncbi:hypothetical protein [Yersinia pekkanenii]|uniref:Uncharacterized protein n=1 Tax=Yersinia pekkanenii TaxID=1288385 RepID=A0A0T9RHL4_9GAMM|nr:hypothetical protein [Yersinia pekkanenii]CNI63124.1 Uncharacterised protein [Yersinia pekkanenii]CRY69542.1 Uncharacterised protein [Yersinia pekkanenii]
MRKKTNAKQRDVTQQRSAKPDELVMLCENDTVFGNRLIYEFRKVKPLQGKANE